MTFSDEVEALLHRAFLAAREAGHEEITPEHIALELIGEDETEAYLTRCGTNLVAVEARLRAYLGKAQPNAGEDVDTQPSSAFQRVVETAAEQTEEDGREYVMLRDLFLALIDDHDTAASIAILEATREPEVFEELRNYSDADEPLRLTDNSRRLK